MSIFSYVKHHIFVVTVSVVAVVIVAAIASQAASHKTSTATNETVTRVSLVNAATFRTDSVAVAVSGTVQSHSQADLRSQMSAPVAVIHVAIGESVYAGETILELQNADLRAQVAQAEAALDAAQGQQHTGTVSVQSATQSAIDKINDAYTKSSDIVNSQIQSILFNNDGNGGRLSTYSADSKLTSSIISADVDVSNSLALWKTQIDALTADSTTASVSQVLTLSVQNVAKIDTLLNDMSKVLNSASTYAGPSVTQSLNAWKATVAAARATLSGITQGLTGAQTSLSTTVVSQNGTVEAGVSAAAAGLNNLKAQLAKTILTSPITGTISALPLHTGELATPGTLLATVVGNTNNLEIKAYVSGEDLARVKVGQPVVISNTVKGVVSNVSPSVDASTKKAEVDIDVMDSAHSGLVIGQNVSASITAAASLGTTSVGAGQNGRYVVPIQDVKIIPGAAYVLTVDQNSKIVRNDVTTGQIRGDFVEITSGLNDSMNIVAPVYELDIGQTVNAEQ